MAGEDVALLREALVAVDPRTGAVRAYYGGVSGTDFDYAQAQRQPGSSMKPYVLATALEQGISVTARRDGSSPQTFPDREGEVVNSGGASCGACTLVEAMTRSLNTTFYGLAYEVGPENVRETALGATGLPDVWEGGVLDGAKTLANAAGGTGSSIGIGEYEMRPIDQAVGFATFANGGIRRAPYFVAKVTDSAGAVLVENAGDPGEPVMSADVAADVTFALKGVATYSKRALEDGREVASKTGTQGLDRQNNSDAWMVGYTPSLSTAVWLGTDGRKPIINSDRQIIYGSGLPGAIWQRFMNTVLAGTPEEDLPDRPTFSGDSGEGVPAPTTSAPPSTSAAPPTPTSAAPTPSETPTETSTSSTATTSETATTSTSEAGTLVQPPVNPGNNAGGNPGGGG
jgi:membrane peptidoglycan carboxypeptidase